MSGNKQSTALLHQDLKERGRALDTREREDLIKQLAPAAKPTTIDGHETRRHARPIREFLARCLYALLFSVMHTIYSVHWRTRLAYSSVVQRVLAVTYYHHRTPALIQRDVKNLSKRPRHLSIILDSSRVAGSGEGIERLINDVCECAAWAACAGIPVLSIYERNGVLKPAMPQLHRYISRTMTSYFGSDNPSKPTISLRAPLMPALSPPSSSPDPTSASGPPHLSIIMLSASDGRRTLVDLTKTLADMTQKRKISAQDVSLELIDAEISESVMEEPDLVMLFGQDDVVLQGYPPWQIRLSEIYHVPRYCGVQYHAFLQGLQKYAGAQMRFGT